MGLILGISGFTSKKILSYIVALSMAFLLTGCQKKIPNDVSSIESNLNPKSDIIVKNDYYKIYCGATEETRFFYYYDLFDMDGNLIKSECTYMNEPTISECSNNIIKISAQAGTGLSTKWSYYYNISSNLFSQIFYHVLAEKETVIAYFDGEQIVICNMFDVESFYKEIKLNNEISNSTDPIEEVVFSDNLDSVTVVYMSGNNFERTTETFLI